MQIPLQFFVLLSVSFSGKFYSSKSLPKLVLRRRFTAIGAWRARIHRFAPAFLTRMTWLSSASSRRYFSAVFHEILNSEAISAVVTTPGPDLIMSRILPFSLAKSLFFIVASYSTLQAYLNVTFLHINNNII